MIVLSNPGIARPSALVAIEQIADRLPARLVRLRRGLAVKFAHNAPGIGDGLFRLAARRTAIGKSGLTGPQFKLLRANHTDFDRKGHRNYVNTFASIEKVVQDKKYWELRAAGSVLCR